ncbi:MAG: hypothetical protein HZB18_16755 [Chloroflexi bacterium]|nr:hypothetical protein [Chloroflexota bacterium]
MRAKWSYILICVGLLLTQAVTPVYAAGAVNGDGLMSVSPTSATYGSSGNTFTFTFTADNDFPNGSQVQLTIPAGWTPPISTVGAGRVSVNAGTCSLIGSPLFAIAGSTIMVDIDSCLSGQSFTITYSGVTIPAPSVSPYSFTTMTDIPGGDGLYEIFSGSPTVTADPKPITVSAAGLTPNNKAYDGNTTATITLGSPSLTAADIVSGDVVSLDTTGPITASFADRNAGTGKTVAISGLGLSGANASRYTLIAPTRTANITPLSITVTAVADSKVYDGSTSSTGVPTLSPGTPLIAPDVEPAWTQTFNNKNAGTGKSLTPAGAVDDGNGGLNYSYNFVPNTTGAITQLPIIVNAVTDTKTYDGSTASSGLPLLDAVTPLAAGDTEPAWTQTFDTKNAGAGKTLTPAGLINDGNGGNNYSYTYTPDLTGLITIRPVTIQADAKSKPIGSPDPILTYHATSGSLATGDTLTLIRASGETPGLYAVSINIFPASANYDLTYIAANLTITPILTFKSQAANDGWILERTQASGLGGTKNSTDTTFQLGDDSAKRQYRGILSFNTGSLPDGAVIQSAVIKIKQSGAPVGANPFNVLGKLMVDVRKGTFGASTLAVTDFQAAPSASQAGTFGKTPIAGWYGVTLNLSGRNNVNTMGLTQFRLYFSKSTNNDAIANLMKFLSGNSASGQPQLIIKYTLP